MPLLLFLLLLAHLNHYITFPSHSVSVCCYFFTKKRAPHSLDSAETNDVDDDDVCLSVCMRLMSCVIDLISYFNGETT